MISRNKRKIVLLLLSINMTFLLLILPTNYYKIDGVDNQYGKESINPISNQPEIEFITPENITYSAPMSGYYPATYGFESDDNLDIPFGWILVQDPIATYTHVIKEKGDHKKVLRLGDYNNSAYSIIENYFEGQEYGTMEFWIRITDISKHFLLNIRGGIKTVILFYLKDGKWRCQNGAEEEVIIPNMPNPSNNRWYHVQIDFECASGTAYQGLDPYSWKVTIDGTTSDRIAFYEGRIPSRLNFTVLSTGSVDSNYDVYIDAVGYPWENNYQIGDNLNEGLLVGIMNSTSSLEWIGYSLDYQSNITIHGNTTIIFPEDGVHTIQVFANNSIGTNYESDLRYFIIDTTSPQITINAPDPNGLFGEESPNFDISIDEVWLNETWYNLDNGELNYFIDELSGKINQTEWDKFNNGTVSINFHCNDSVGLIDSAQVIVRKDILAPVINITTPSLYQLFNETPSFSIEIIEGNLESLWYSLDDGQTNITITGFSGTINEYAWEQLPTGEVTIRFYAKDTLQHESYKDIIVVKELPEQIDDNGDEGLPIGTWIIIISSIVGVALVVPVLFWYIKSKKPKEFF